MKKLTFDLETKSPTLLEIKAMLDSIEILPSRMNNVGSHYLDIIDYPDMILPMGEPSQVMVERFKNGIDFKLITNKNEEQ